MRWLSNPVAMVLVAALLSIAAGRAAAVSYYIDVQYGGPGTVTPSGVVEVPAGGSQSFTFTPTGCYAVGDVMVDDVYVGVGLTQYTFTNVESDHAIYVLFGKQLTTTALQVRPGIGQCAVPETLTATVTNSDGGQVQFLCNNLSTLGGQLKGGTVRALFVTTAERLKEYPDIPTAREMGMPKMEQVMGWSGLYGPPGLPTEVVNKWVDTFKKLAVDPEWLKGNAGFGGVPAIRSPADTEKFAREQYEAYEKLGTTLGLRK